MALFENFWSHAPTLKANTLKAENFHRKFFCHHLAILVMKIEAPYLWNKDFLGAGLPSGSPVFWLKRLTYRNSLPRGNEA
jgi:hypothetical protein